MANSIRSRAPEDIHLERFVEASQSPETRLTHSAVIGARKQSVEDPERFFSPFVLEWMQNKGYEAEAKLVDACYSWHRSSDERGLSQQQRREGNKKMLNYLLDELLPWHRVNYDLSTLDINR